jgi:HPt (histidine-containing phosphotransfer) domain-containing protein
MATTFDQAQLLERVDHDRAFLAETVGMLASDGRGLMQDIRAAIDAGDAGALGRAAHALKGMISNFCAPAAQEAALVVERAGKGGDLAGAPRAAGTLSEELEALIAELERFVGSGT